ncbi:MAG: phosphatidylglycerophosphatase A [candidate division NC10 bacterium]|nr:phosphatidylglycerophosphatase A [candidate division NC10 bacterium]
MDKVILFLATGAYSGFFPYFPGTVGSTLGVGVFLLLSRIPQGLHLALLLALGAIGVYTAGRAEVLLGARDAKPIVIDEIFGYQVAMLFLPPRPLPLLLALFFFRLYDIWKPFPVKQTQILPGGLGVMADDLVAGAYTNITLRIFSSLFGGV